MTATPEAPVRTVTMPLSPRSPRLPRPAAAAERIVLTGFMGSGKTTVGRLLALELGWTFVDLDTLIEQRAGSTVPAIFAEQGEGAFRQHESAALAAVLRLPRHVIALGGGAPETLTNRLLLEQTPATAVVFLAAPFASLEARCVEQAADPSQTARPVFTDRAAAQLRFANRQPLYRRLAHIIVDNSAQTPSETVAGLLAAVAGVRLPD